MHHAIGSIPYQAGERATRCGAAMSDVLRRSVCDEHRGSLRGRRWVRNPKPMADTVGMAWNLQPVAPRLRRH
jgi:hypothetical protein